MQRVGQKLQETAISSPTDEDFDQFGRSAFNRYYYAMYLRVRDLLRIFDQGWDRMPHKNMPDCVHDAVYKLIKKRADQQKKRHALTHAEHSKLCSESKQATLILSGLLKTGNAIRVLADYHPDLAVSRARNSYSLGGEPVSQASRWYAQAAQYARVIEAAWDQVK